MSSGHSLLRHGLGALVIASLAAPSCSKSQDKQAPEQIEALPKEEVDRARTACQRYVARVCACAETEPSLADECTLAKARPEALQLNLDLASTPGLDKAEQQAVKVEARKIAAACFEAEGRLDPQSCPRP